MGQKFEQYRDMWKAMAPIFLILWVCGLLFFFGLESISPPGMRTPRVPEITFRNVGPCPGFDQDLVERFESGNPQYICADMETEESAVYLELHVFTSDKKKQVYVTGGTFSPGPIAFYIDPLPLGKYWAKISWARPALVDFEFEVVNSK